MAYPIQYDPGTAPRLGMVLDSIDVFASERVDVVMIANCAFLGIEYHSPKEPA